MKYDQLVPFFGKIVTLQLARDKEWIAMGWHGTSPQGEVCHIATQIVSDEQGKPVRVPVGPLDLIGPCMIEGVVDRNGAILITQAGPDGSKLQILCDPEVVLYATSCVEKPKTAESPRIVTP